MFNEASEKRLAELHPELATKIRQIDAMLPDLRIQVAQGFRSWNEQNSLYSQGRTSPGSIVTNAAPGHSWHEFGLAVDIFPENKITSLPDWDARHPAWLQLIGAGVSLGLASGSAWKHCPDNPHFQMTGKFGVTPDNVVRELFARGGLAAVWNAAFANGVGQGSAQ